MIVQCHCTVGKGLFANGIERTTNRLWPIDSSLTKSTIRSAKTNTVLVVARKTTFAPTDNARYQIAITVTIDNALLIQNLAGTRIELHAHSREHTLEFTAFLGRDWRTGFTFDAACPTTSREVTAKIFSKNIGRQKNVTHLKNREHGNITPPGEEGRKQLSSKNDSRQNTPFCTWVMSYQLMGCKPCVAR